MSINNVITVAVANQKGCVGKTTIAYNLAQILADRHRKKVLVVDNDPQGNLTISFLESSAHIRVHIADVCDGKAPELMQITKNLYLVGSDITLAPVAERDFQVVFRLKDWVKRLNVAQQPAKFILFSIGNLPSYLL